MKMKFALFFFFVIVISIITNTILNTGYTLKNKTIEMNTTILNEVKAFETEYVYNEKIPKTADSLVLKEGVNGLDSTYDGLNYIHISDVSNEVVQLGSGKDGEYTGRLTGYGPDCPGCSSVGNVSCKTREGKNHSLITDGLYYNDTEYGSVRILAADHSAFSCGTIVKINNGVLPEFYGIVLDSGYTMRNAWSNGTVWMDLAFSSQKVALTGGATSSNTKFSVQRWGW